MTQADAGATRRLGAVLAGGRSSRFGSDKALATIDGERLVDRTVAALAPHCEAVVVIGRDDPAHTCAPDWPRPGLGPLGGLAGALRHGRDHGFDEVLSAGVDSLDLPADLARRLSPAPAFVATQPVIGLWPIDALAALEEILVGPGSHAVKRFAERIGARAVTLDHDPGNVNRPEDLARHRRGDA